MMTPNWLVCGKLVRHEAPVERDKSHQKGTVKPDTTMTTWQPDVRNITFFMFHPHLMLHSDCSWRYGHESISLRTCDPRILAGFRNGPVDHFWIHTQFWSRTIALGDAQSQAQHPPTSPVPLRHGSIPPPSSPSGPHEHERQVARSSGHTPEQPHQQHMSAVGVWGGDQLRNLLPIGLKMAQACTQ